ncbi:MAG: hypothetical protein WBV78_12230, partial [Roseobacter sp.]
MAAITLEWSRKTTIEPTPRVLNFYSFPSVPHGLTRHRENQLLIKLGTTGAILKEIAQSCPKASFD